VVCISVSVLVVVECDVRPDVVVLEVEVRVDEDEVIPFLLSLRRRGSGSMIRGAGCVEISLL
jgi:hypothetical protein